MSRVVLVTGAGGGIGSAVAARFARRGDRVLLTDLAGASLEATSARLDAPAFAADLRTPAACTALLDWAVATAGGVDVLVNAADRKSTRLNSSH